MGKAASLLEARSGSVKHFAVSLAVTTICADRCISKYFCDGIFSRAKVDHSEKDLKALLLAAKKVLLSEPSLLEIDAPIHVCGDLFGQFSDLHSIFKKFGEPPAVEYLFLGNYINKGTRSL